MKMMIFAVVIVVVTFNFCETLDVYNCSAPESDLKYETISLVDLPKCEYENVKPNIDRTNAYIVQEIRRKTITVRKCSVAVIRSVYYCDTGHRDAKSYTRRTYGGTCSDMHDYKKYNYYKNQWVDTLQINRTNSVSAVLAGSIDENGRCTGENFADEFSTSVNAVVQERYDIHLQQFSSIVDTVSQEVSLPNGLRCSFDDHSSSCEGIDGAVYCWESKHENRLELMEGVVVIYNGQLDLVTYSYPPTDYSYSYQENDYRYAVLNNTKNFISIRLQTKIWRYFRGRDIEIYKTNVPDLYVFEWKSSDSLLLNASLADSDVSLNIQYLTKLDGIDLQLFQQFSQLIPLTLYNDCVLYRANLENKLSVAFTNPSEFAYMYSGPGAKAYVSGDVIHITRCPVVEGYIRYTAECYQTITVEVDRKKMFANARTRILQESDTPIPCDKRRMMIKYNSSPNKWYDWSISSSRNYYIPAYNPLSITKTWSYKSMSNIISGGVYSYEQIEKSRKAFTHPTSSTSEDDSWRYRIVINGTEALTTAGKTRNWLSDKLIAFWCFSAATGKIFTGIVGIWLMYEIVSFLFWMLVDLFALGFSWKLLKLFFREAMVAALSMLTKRFSTMKKYVHRSMRSIANNDENNSSSALSDLDLEDGTNLTTLEKSNL